MVIHLRRKAIWQSATWLAVAAASIALLSCPRSYPQGQDPADYARVTHPWEQSGWSAPQPVAGPDLPAATPQDQVKTPERRGPALAQQDTLSEPQLPGNWLQVCTARNEVLSLAPLGQRFVLELQASGKAAYRLDREGKVQLVEGSWHKTQPGVISFLMQPDTVESPMYAELYNGQFFYMWSYDHQQGLWYARLPAQAAPRIAANRFSTSRGELRFTNVIGSQITGTLTENGAANDVSGYYQDGVLALNWVDKARNAAGFAMFIVSPDWKTLDGVWWLDDYEAAPFGGDWKGTAL